MGQFGRSYAAQDAAFLFISLASSLFISAKPGGDGGASAPPWAEVADPGRQGSSPTHRWADTGSSPPSHHWVDPGGLTLPTAGRTQGKGPQPPTHPWADPGRSQGGGSLPTAGRTQGCSPTHPPLGGPWVAGNLSHPPLGGPWVAGNLSHPPLGGPRAAVGRNKGTSSYQCGRSQSATFSPRSGL